MNVQNINSLPDFIDKFIKFNHDKLIEIYDGGIKEYKEGLLYFQCDKEKNNVDSKFRLLENLLQKTYHHNQMHIKKFVKQIWGKSLQMKKRNEKWKSDLIAVRLDNLNGMNI